MRAHTRKTNIQLTDTHETSILRMYRKKEQQQQLKL